MNILFLSCWNINDPLTKATILPNLKLLEEFKAVDHVLFVNTEREETNFEPDFNSSKITYKPLYPLKATVGLVTKGLEFFGFVTQLKLLVKKYDIDLVIARGATAGSLAYLLWRRSTVPYIVESFEPHAEYMRYSGTWKKWSPLYFFQKKWEQAQKETAFALITVSNNYKRKMQTERVDSEKIKVAPCAVDTNSFYVDNVLRYAVRRALNISPDKTVGIYAGKFGGLYYDRQAFVLFRSAFEYFGEAFYLLLLSSINEHELQFRCREHRIPRERIILKFVEHSEMNGYLNASDFGFAPYKHTPVAVHLSPVKVGEYWASGLPVVMTAGVGDESEFLEGTGVVSFSKEDIERNEVHYVFDRLQLLLNKYNKSFFVELAKKYRSIDNTRSVYAELLNKMGYE